MKRQILLEYSNADFKKWANDSGLVARFRELKSRIPAGKPEADIGFWIKNKQPEDLAKFLDDLVQQAAEKAAKRDKAREGARLIYDKNGWRCYHITSYEAAARMGRGTRWCITGRYEGHESRGQYYFDSYLESNYKAYYFLFQDNYKGTGKFPDNKWAICIHKYDDGYDIWQADDQPISVILRDVPSDIPEIPFVGMGRILDIQDGVVIGSNAHRDELSDKDIGIVAASLGAYAIGDNAFTFSRGLTDATLSTDGLSSIGKLAFASTALTDVKIAKDTTHVGEKCFKGCRILDYLEWDSTAPILNETFASCTALNMIIFYHLPSDIAANAFANCPNISNITLPCRLEDCPENIRKVLESMESQPEFRELRSDLREDIRDAVTQTAHGKIKLADVYKSDQAREAFRKAAARDAYFFNLDDIDLHNSDYMVVKSHEEITFAPYYDIRVVLPAGTVTTDSGFDVHYPVLVLLTQDGGAECGSGYSDFGIEVGGQFKHIYALTNAELLDFAWEHGAIFRVDEQKINPKLHKERRSNLGAYPHLYTRKFYELGADAADTAIRIGYEDGPRVSDEVLPNLISFKTGLSNIRYANFEKTLNAATHTLRQTLKDYRLAYQREAALNDINSNELYLAMRIESMESSLNALKDIKAKLRYFESAVDLLTAGLPDINGVVSPNRARSLGSYIQLNRTRAAAEDEYNDALKDWDRAKAIDFLDTKVRRVSEIVNYVTQVTATLDRRVKAQAGAQDNLTTAEKKFNDAKADQIDTLNAQIEKAAAEVDDYNKQIKDLLNKVKTKRNKSGLKEDIRDAVGKNGVSLTKALDSNNSKYSQNWSNAERDDKGHKIDYHRSEYIPITPEEAFKIVKGSGEGYKQVKAVLPVDGKSRLVALTNRASDSTYGSSMVLPSAMYFTTKDGSRTGSTNRMLQSSEGLMHILNLAYEYGGLWRAVLVPRDSETTAKRAQNPESPNFEDSAFDSPKGSNKEITKRHNATPYGYFDNGSFKRRMDSYYGDLKRYRTKIEQATQRLEAAKQLDDNAMPPRESQMRAAQNDIIYYTEELGNRMGTLVWIMADLMDYKNEAARRRYYDSEKQLQQNISTYKSLAKKRDQAISRKGSYETILGNIMNALPGDMVDTKPYLYDVSMEVRKAQKAVKLAEKKVIELRADLENFDDIKSSLPHMSQQEIDDLFRKVNDNMAQYMELEAEMNDFLGRENQ